MMKIKGFPVYDAKAGMELTINRRDTTSGRKDPWNCAAAKCILRMPGVIEVRVFRSKTYVLRRNPTNDLKFWTRYHTSAALRTELIAFDRGGTFDPGVYYLGKIAPMTLLGARHRPSGKHAGHNAKRAAAHVLSGVRQRAAHYTNSSGLR
jgi:hypothetical protein